MHVRKQLVEQLDIDLDNDLALSAIIREASEEAKIALSSAESTTIDIPFVVAGKPPFSMELTRQELNIMIADLIECTKKPIEQALNDASLEKEEIDDILLVGGTTLIPAVHEFVKQYFQKEPLKGDPYEAVALGAAIAGTEYINIKSGIAKNIEISDVVSRSLGVQVADGTVSKVLDRNTKIPIARTRQYTNAGHFVDRIVIPVYQGEEEYAHDNDYLGEFWISIEPMPLHQNNIEVTFEVGKEFGILHVTAKDTDSENERTVKLEAQSRLSKKDKNKWMKKLLGVESAQVTVVNMSTDDSLVLYLNQWESVSDFKDELMKKGIMDEGDTIFCDDIELEDDTKIIGTNIETGSIIEIRHQNE